MDGHSNESKPHGHDVRAGGCCAAGSGTSVHQTLDEMAFERGIWYSAMHGDVQKLRSLMNNVRRPVDPNLTDSYGYTALHYASGHGHLAACEELLRHGADPNATTKAGNATPLHRAALRGHMDVVRILANKGGRLDVVDADGMTPLHKAAESGRTDICRFILSLEPSVESSKDNRGRTAADLMPK